MELTPFLSREQICTLFNCNSEQLTEQYRKNILQMEKMKLKAIQTGNKVNGFTPEQLQENINKFKLLID